MTDKRKPRRTTEMIAAGELFIDHRVQRELIAARVKGLAEKMDLDSVGVVTVNRREDGKNSVVDGQHRVAALLRLDLGEWKVKCDTYHGLSLDDEARLWRRLNNTRRPTAFDDFRAALVEGDAESVAIDEMICKHGLRLHNQKVDGAIQCVNALRQVYRLEPEALDSTIAMAIAAWGPTTDAVEGHLIGGLGRLLAQHNGDIDRTVLAKKLAKFPGGPRALVGKARGLRDLRPGTVQQHLATIVTDIYNSKRRTSRVEA